MKVQKVLRWITGAIIGICGFSTAVTVDQVLKNTEMPKKCKWMRSVTRYTMIYVIYGLFMLFGYKFLNGTFGTTVDPEDIKPEKHMDEAEIVDEDDEDDEYVL